MKKIIVSILMVGLVISMGVARTLAYTVNPNEESEDGIVGTEDVTENELLEDIPTQEEETVEDVVTEETTEDIEGNETTEEEVEGESTVKDKTEDTTEEEETEGVNSVFNPNWKPHKFVDANNDRICDNCNDKYHQNYVDENGDGICDNINHRHPFNDVDKDGVCDICGRENHGNKFVDLDGDGICDSFGDKDSPVNKYVENNGFNNKGFEKRTMNNQHKGKGKGNKF